MINTDKRQGLIEILIKIFLIRNKFYMTEL